MVAAEEVAEWLDAVVAVVVAVVVAAAADVAAEGRVTDGEEEEEAAGFLGDTASTLWRVKGISFSSGLPEPLAGRRPLRGWSFTAPPPPPPPAPDPVPAAAVAVAIAVEEEEEGPASAVAAGATSYLLAGMDAVPCWSSARARSV